MVEQGPPNGHHQCLFAHGKLHYLLPFQETHQNQTDYIFAGKDGKALYSKQKQDQELTVAQIMSSLLPNSDLN